MSYALMVFVFAAKTGGGYYVHQVDTSTGWNEAGCRYAAKLIMQQSSKDKFKTTVLVPQCVPTRKA